MENLKRLKDAMLLDGAEVGLLEHMNRHAKKVIGSMALVAAVAMSPTAHAADMNAGGWTGGVVGAVIGKVAGDALGVNSVLSVATGALALGKVSNDAYAENQDKKEKQAAIDAREKLSPQMEERMFALMKVAAEALAIVKYDVKISNAKEMDQATLPGDAKTEGEYRAAVIKERTDWNQYIQKRDAFFNAVNTANKHGFNVEAYKASTTELINAEKNTIGEINARATSAYWQRKAAPHYR